MTQQEGQTRHHGTCLDLTGLENRGVAPLGIKGLLDATMLNNVNMWQRAQVFLRQGVLVPRSALTVETVEKRIEQIAQCYPVRESRKALAVAVHERFRGGGGGAPGFAFRGDHLLGDDADVARLWIRLFKGDVLVHGWNVRTEAMCWTGLAPETVCVPYLDLDEYDYADQFSRVWETRVLPTLRAVNSAFLTLGVVVAKCRMVGCVRPSQLEGLTKFSFHLHWPGLGVETQAIWKKFLLMLVDVPRKVEWKEIDADVKHAEGERYAVSEAVPSAPLFDPAVYGGKRQLFRGPYCGKTGRADAVMLPLRVTGGGGEPYVPEFLTPGADSDNDEVKVLLETRIAAFRTEVTMVDVTAYDRGSSLSGRVIHAEQPVRVREGGEGSSAAPDLTIPRLVRFCMPLFEGSVLPVWQQFRYDLMVHLGGGGGAVVPTRGLEIIHNREASRKGRVFFSVQGDSFCEKDAAHIHTSHPGRIGMEVNFLRCTIRQTCHVCGPSVKFPEYAFLHAGNNVRIEPYARCGHSRITCWTKSPNPYHLLLEYYRSDFVLQRLIKVLWVYDAEARVWQSGTSGNMAVGKLVDALNQRHEEYISAQRRCFIDAQLWKYDQQDGKAHEADDDDSQAEEDNDAEGAAAEDEDEEEGKKRPKSRAAAVKKYEAAARKFIKENTPLLSFTPAARKQLLLDLRGYHVRTEIHQMNPITHYIAMKNGQYIDVFTGATGEMERHHYFTHTVNAIYNPEDANIPLLSRWFEEISTGDLEKALYLKRISAYCFTFLIHDRKYYILVGNGKNAKGTIKEFIIKVCTGPDGYDARFKNMGQAFWSARGNADTKCEAPSPEAFDMREKTFFYTDDLAPVLLDSNKLKRVVAGEGQNARGLYAEPVEIYPRGKVMFTSNFDVAGPGDDQAFWERTVAVRMRAKYVEQSHMVNEKEYRFLKDHSKYERYLTMLDAFFTITVSELIKYYRRVVAEGGVFGSFPLPVDVEESTRVAKEKRLPLATFIRQATKDTTHPLYYCRLDDLFKNYLVFLGNANETRIARETTIGKFRDLLAMALGIEVIDQPGGAVVEGKQLVTTVRPDADAHQYTGFVDSRGQKRPYEEIRD